VDKGPDAFRTISEVAEDLDLPQHVLRFWETRFAQIKPLKRGGGRRYYRPDDVELLKGIRHLLYGEGYTIKGVQRILKDHGVRAVIELAGGKAPAGKPEAILAEGIGEELTAAIGRPPRPATPPKADDQAVEAAPRSRWPFSRQPAKAETETPPMAAADVGEPLPAGILADDAPARSTSFMERLRGEGHGGLSREDIRRLQSTLFELLECKRLLDHTR
jgi:DNA-binding transcriptional MerR regulator